MAIVENVFDTMPNRDADNDALKAYLDELKDQAVRSVLSKVFDNNERASIKVSAYGRRVDVSWTDYSAMIISRASVLDDAVGYQQACNVLELMLSTARSNTTERTGKDYQTLKVELEGFTNEGGHLVSRGLFYKLNGAIISAIDILFPVDKPKNILRNASNKW